MVDTFTRLLSFASRLLTWFCIVQPWERGLCVRLGKRVREMGPGVHFVVPFADVIFVQNMRLRVMHCTDQTVTTLDGKPLCVTGNVSFTVSDIRQLYMSVHQPESILRRDVQAAIAQYVSARYIVDCKPADLEAVVNEKLDLAAYGLGGGGFCLTDWLTVRSLRIINQGLGEWINSNFNTDQQRTPAANGPA